MAPALTPVEEALAKIVAQAIPLAGDKRSEADRDTELLALTDALGRVLAKSERSTVDVPPCDNSAMDGYAFNFADFASAKERCRAKVSQRIPAGHQGQALQPGTVARIFTGAMMPPGADTVLMQEDAQQLEGDEICFQSEGLKQGQHVRPRGQDIAVGDTVVTAGRRLRPQDIGILASVGLTHLRVVRQLRVAIVSTGDELVEPGQPLVSGQIYNSNRYMLHALLRELGCEVVDGGVLPDDFEQTCERFKQLADQADVLLSSGGVSVGEEDHVKAAVESLGELSLWKLNIKPGKPLAFGHIDGPQGRKTPFIGLPGNPSSVFVTFNVLARPFLQRSQGLAADPERDELSPLLQQVKANFNWPKPGSRQEYLRVFVRAGQAGLSADIYANQSSGVLLSTSWANALAVIPPGMTLEPGDTVEVIMLSELGC